MEYIFSDSIAFGYIPEAWMQVNVIIIYPNQERYHITRQNQNNMRIKLFLKSLLQILVDRLFSSETKYPPPSIMLHLKFIYYFLKEFCINSKIPT